MTLAAIPDHGVSPVRVPLDQAHAVGLQLTATLILFLVALTRCEGAWP